MSNHKCYMCHKLRTEETMVKIWKHYICDRCITTKTITDKNNPFKRLLIDNVNVFACKECGKAITKEMYENNDWCCVIHWINMYGHHWKMIKCLKCWCIHSPNESCCEIKWLVPPANEWMFVGSNASKRRDPKWYANIWWYGDALDRIFNRDKLDRQTQVAMPNDVEDWIYNFYEGSCFEKEERVCNHWKDIDVSWSVDFMNSPQVYNVIREQILMMCDRTGHILWWEEISKYSNMKVTWVKDWKLERTKINIMWKVVKSYESINKFFKDVWRKETNAQINWHYTYRMSTDLNHKLQWAIANSSFGSCQQSNNNESYASGAYDFITNGCNVPLLIYKDWIENPIWRILCRLMYDKKGKEYLVVERLYHNWEFWGQHWSNASKWYVHKAIVEDLIKKWFNVVASPYSAHDESTLVYMMTMWMKRWTEVKDLRQPVRVLNNDYGYYCDWWTTVHKWIEDDKNWIPVKYWMDYLNKWYLLSLE